MLPSELRRMIRGEPTRYVLDLGQSTVVFGKLDENGFHELASSDVSGCDGLPRATAHESPGTEFKKESTVVIRLPKHQALRKTITLPIAVEPNLRESLALQLDRQMPFKASQVYVDHRVIARDAKAGQLTVELAIVEKALVDQAVDFATRAGIRPAAVSLRDDSSAEGACFNFYSQGSAAQLKKSTVTNLALSAVLLLLFVLAITGAEGKHERIVAYLDHEIGLAAEAAREAQQLDREVSDLVSKLEFLRSRKSARVFLPTLNDLSKALPDDAWLHEFQMRNREIRILGYSPNASQLVGLIEAAPLFENVHFTAPVTRAPASGLERFDLSFSVNGGLQE